MRTEWREKKLKDGTTKKLPVLLVREWEANEGYPGFCLSCGTTNDGVEPDAVGYLCEECGAEKVCGLEYGFLMGRVRLELDAEEENL